MARITLNLEPLASLYSNGADMARSLVKNGLGCEIAGADGVSIGLGQEGDQKRRRVISLLVDSLEIPLSVKCGYDQRSLETLQDIKPNLVIFPYYPEKRDFLESAITNLQIENILTGLETPLELEQVKEAAKLKCDYIILNCGAYCSSGSLNARIDELSKISKLVALSGRLSLGNILTGDFTNAHLSQIAKAAQVEEYLLGLPFFSNALIYGYKSAIENARSALSA